MEYIAGLAILLLFVAALVYFESEAHNSPSKPSKEENKANTLPSGKKAENGDLDTDCYLWYYDPMREEIYYWNLSTAGFFDEKGNDPRLSTSYNEHTVEAFAFDAPKHLKKR